MGPAPEFKLFLTLPGMDFNAFNVVLNTGFDMKLAVLNLFAHVNYAVGTRAPGAILGMRIQI